VSPRGKAIPGVEEQLFGAAERVLAHSGPIGLTSRAITGEAGCAKGVLHNHFGDLIGFLAAFVVSQSTRLAESARKLPTLAGTNTVLDNLADAAVALFGRSAITISSLVVSRPDVAQRLLEEGTAAPVLHEIEAAFAEYLAAEQRLGRIAAGTDTRTLVFTVFASAHHLFFTEIGRPIPPDRVRHILTSLLSGVAT
jgi:AcrR family transcriptional regulator